MKSKFKRFLSAALCMIMLMGAVPVSAAELIDDPLTGSTGSGWSTVDGGAPSEDTPPDENESVSSDSDPEIDSGKPLPPSSSEVVTPDDSEASSSEGEGKSEQTETPPTEDLTLGATGVEKHWLQQYQE